MCGNCVFGVAGRGAGSERASGSAGRVGGELAWNEMEEGTPGQPFLVPFPLSLPSCNPGARVRGARRASVGRWAREPVGARCQRMGWAGVVPRHARRSFDLAEGSREGRAHVTPARPRVAGVGREKGLVWGGELRVLR